MDIVVENLSYTYLDSKASSLQNISLRVEQGDIVLITGRSGCGKTTLAWSICGLIPHMFGGKFAGRIIVNGKNTLEHTVYELAREVGLVFQNPVSQFCTLTVEDEIAFGPENLGLPKEDIERRIDQALRFVEMQKHRCQSLTSLSDGQKQRIAIASIFSMLPDILILDEPTSNIEPGSAKNILEMLINLKEQGKTIILIEHRIPETILAHIDKLVVMESGKILYYGSPQPYFIKDLLRPTTLKNCFVKSRSPAKEVFTFGEELLKLENILYKYKESDFTLEVDNLTIHKGEVLAIIGANGSGKTTLTKIIAGLLKPKGGKILKKSHIRIGMVFQNPEIQLFNLTVRDEIAFNLKSRNGQTIEIEELLKGVDLSDKENAHPQSLSQGEKKRLALAMILASDSEVIILDEPSTGLDKQRLDLLVSKIKAFKRRDKAIVLITHDLELVNETADKVMILEAGKIDKIFERNET